jgi:hypothetical protein
MFTAVLKQNSKYKYDLYFFQYLAQLEIFTYSQSIIFINCLSKSQFFIHLIVSIGIIKNIFYLFAQ